MRPLHLVGLRGTDGQKLRYFPSDDGPMFLPSWMASCDVETLLVFCQQVLADSQLNRIDVDWHNGLAPADTRFLSRARDRQGSEDCLVVVRLHGDDVALDDVLGTAEIKAWQHVAVTSAQPVVDEPLGRLLEVNRFVRSAAEDLYDELASEFEWSPEGNAIAKPIVDSILNPILVLEAYNALFEMQGQGVPVDRLPGAIQGRLLTRILNQLPRNTCIALAALASAGVSGLERALPMHQRNEALQDLRHRMLIRNQKLVRWAAWLQDQGLSEIVLESLSEIDLTAQLAVSARLVSTWIGVSRQESANFVQPRIVKALASLEAGKPAAARQLLSSVETSVDVAGAPVVGAFWEAVARLNAFEGRWSLAEMALRRALANLPPRSASRGAVLHRLACLLRDTARWSEARSTFEELFAAESGPISLAHVLDFACGLRDNGQWPRAEVAFEYALILAPEARGRILHEYACGLRDSGDWTRAETLFRESLEWKRSSADTATSLADTMHELACGLRDHQRWPDAEALFRQALAIRESGDTSLKKAASKRELARGLRTAGRYAEARDLLSSTLIESASSPMDTGLALVEQQWLDRSKRNLPTKPPPSRNELLCSDLEAMLDRILHTRRTRSPVEAPEELTRAYVTLEIACGMTAIGERQRAESLARGATATLDQLDPVHKFLSRAYCTSVAEGAYLTSASRMFPAPILAESGALEDFLRYKVDRLRDRSFSFGFPVVDAIASFRNATQIRRVRAALSAAPDRLAAAQLQLAHAAQAAGEVRSEVLGVVIDHLPELPREQAVALLEDVLAVLTPEDESAWERCARIAVRLDEDDPTRTLTNMIGSALRTIAANAPVMVAASAAWHWLLWRGSIESHGQVMSWVDRLAVDSGDTQALLANLALAGWLAANQRVELAEERFQRVAKSLTRPSPVHDRIVLSRALSWNIRWMPDEPAGAILRAMQDQISRTTDSYNTNSHFCLSVVALADALVWGHVVRSFEL